MKKSIFILSAAIATALTACDTNAWNDHLDGFEGRPEITDVQSINYELTDADYAAIASNATNVALAGEEKAAALKAVGTAHCFSDEIPASDYLPAFLSSTSFPYYTLSNKSAVNVTYRQANALPAILAELGESASMTISTTDYQTVWGSDDDFIKAFSPSKKPASYIPALIDDNSDIDPFETPYCVVTYNLADQDPIFATVGGGDAPSYAATLVKTMTSGKYLIVADGLAATCLAETKTYGYFYDPVAVESDGKGIATLPEGITEANWFTFTATEGGYYIQDTYGRYYYMSGTYNSFNCSTEKPEDGSAVWTVTFNADGNAVITNSVMGKWIQYSSGYSSYGAYATESGSMPALYIASSAAKAPAHAPVVEVPYQSVCALYHYSSGKWAPVTDVALVQPGDYATMGSNYGNLQGTQPEEFLPTWLKLKYPYAVADDTHKVMFRYYNSGATTWRCDEFVYDGTTWSKDLGITVEKGQFVRNNNVWNYDPSVTITLPSGKGIEISTKYYQACVDWVYENIDKPLGSTGLTWGKGYISSYGNNEYYSGTSAYQGDLDLRAAKALEQYPAGYEGMTNDEIVELMKRRFAYEVMPGALSNLHPDANTVEGIEVLYTINFVVYTTSNAPYTIVYRVTGPGQFEFVECDWWEGGKPEGSL